MKNVIYDETKWKLVPVEPTDVMALAAIKVSLRNPAINGVAQYNAMLAVAPTPPAAEQAQQAVVFVHELSMGAYRPEEIEARAKAIAKLAPLDAQQDAEKVDAQPSDGKRTFATACLMSGSDGQKHTFSGVLGVHTAQTEEEAKGYAVTWAMEARPGLGVHEVLCLEVKREAQPDPAMAGDEWLKEIRQAAIDLARDIFALTPTEEITTTKAQVVTSLKSVNAIMEVARKRVQPASGEDAK